MRDALTRLLYEAHPDLYALRHGSPMDSALPGNGIEHGDGWFALTAALSETITAWAPGARVRQCKAELASYRLLLDGGDAFCTGAIRAAETVAVRFSELSGRPGRPMVRRPPLTRVLAPAEAHGWRPVPGVPPPPTSADALCARHRAILAGAAIDLPERYLDLVDGWLDGLPIGARLKRLGLDDASHADAGAADETLGALDFLRRLARRVDPATGAVGPVDDAGRPPGAR
jgi:hypothetical protein